MKTYITTKDIIIPKGTKVDDNNRGDYEMVIGYGRDFAQIIQITDMEGMFVENLLKEVK